jgi:hypothetical protein
VPIRGSQRILTNPRKSGRTSAIGGALSRPDGTDSPKKANVDLSCFSNPSPIFCLEFVKPWGRQEGGRTFCDVTKDMIYEFAYPKTDEAEKTVALTT